MISDLDRQWLLLHVLGQSETSWLFAHPEYKLTPAETEEYNKLLAERATGKPLAYILGTCEFYGREFMVNEHVLIPRPATENLIDQALPHIDVWYKKHGRLPVIADIGTGSGCIAITLALEFAGVVIYATDISPPALKIAQQNAAKHNVADKIEFIQGNMLEPLAGKKIDLIVSNPPYIPSAELHQPPTADTIGLTFEPQQALDGGPDGQKYIEQIKASGIPAIIEVTGGKVEMFNMKEKAA